MSKQSGAVNLYLDSKLTPPSFTPIVIKDQKDPKKNVKLAKMIIADPSIAFSLDFDWDITGATQLKINLNMGVDGTKPKPYRVSVELQAGVGKQVNLNREFVFVLPFVDMNFHQEPISYFYTIDIQLLDGNGTRLFGGGIGSEVPWTDVRKGGRMAFKVLDGPDPSIQSYPAKDTQSDVAYRNIWFHPRGSTFEIKLPQNTRGNANEAQCKLTTLSSGHGGLDDYVQFEVYAPEGSDPGSFDLSEEWRFTWLPQVHYDYRPEQSIKFDVQAFKPTPPDANQRQVLPFNNVPLTVAASNFATSDVAIYVED